MSELLLLFRIIFLSNAYPCRLLSFMKYHDYLYVLYVLENQCRGTVALAAPRA